MKGSDVTRILVTALLLLAGGALAQPGPCNAPQNSQFDFWLGTWQVSTGGKVVGRNVVAKVQGGCTVTENYHAVGGPYEGSSFNWYDPAGDRWHQVWVDNGGTRLMLRGGLKDGSMVLTGERTLQGATVSDRITWTPNPDGSVRQHWEQSRDGGLGWGTIFDGLYTPVAP